MILKKLRCFTALFLILPCASAFPQAVGQSFELICTGSLNSDSSSTGKENKQYQESREFLDGNYIWHTLRSGQVVTIKIPCKWSPTEISCPEGPREPSSNVSKYSSTGFSIDRRTGRLKSKTLIEYVDGGYLFMEHTATCDLAPSKKRF